MDKNQMMGLLSEAAREIEGLRREAQLLRAQMEVVHIFGRCAGPAPYDNRPQGVDVLWSIRNEINEIGQSMATDSGSD